MPTPSHFTKDMFEQAVPAVYEKLKQINGERNLGWGEKEFISLQNTASMTMYHLRRDMTPTSRKTSKATAKALVKWVASITQKSPFAREARSEPTEEKRTKFHSDMEIVCEAIITTLGIEEAYQAAAHDLGNRGSPG